MSTHRGRRVSRGLIGLLVVVLVLGGAFYLHNTDRSAARESPKRVAPTPVTVAPPPAPTTAPVAVASATSTQPVTSTPRNDVYISSIPSSAVPQAGSASGVRSSATLAPATQPTSASGRGSGSTFADAMARKESGDLLAARTALNDQLANGQLSAADARKCRESLAEINQVVVFSPKRFADDAYGGTYSVQPGNLLKKIAEDHEVTWELLCRVNNLSDPRKLRAGQTIKVIKGPFHAVVSKSQFTMDLYVGAAPGEKGSMFVTSFPVGLGRDDSTPTGVWMVEPHKKIKNPTYFSPRGEGVIDADDPKNPLGERWIGLTGIDGHAVGKASYGIHGTIEPDSIGKMASMGCIRMRNEDVEKVFELLIEGKSTVVVRE